MDPIFAFALVGFFAQLADSALGMGFGVISSSVLLAQGVPPPMVSAAVNAAKLPTGMASGFSHMLNRNIDWRIFLPVAASGIAGGISGALILGEFKRPILTFIIAGYLILIGLLILRRAIVGNQSRLFGKVPRGGIGFLGGLIEGIGGSWGPVVTSGLIGSGIEPRRAIGSSALAELCVSLTVFLVLMLSFQAGRWGHERELHDVIGPVIGLIAGGVPAALIGGKLAAIVPRRPLSIAVGLLALAIGVQRLVSLM